MTCQVLHRKPHICVIYLMRQMFFTLMLKAGSTVLT